ncbi:hypothetical protein SteCoe_16461 [Stentor coeruleus]|uniref:Fe2OG dioxygenase domain-containing protein n=1 Tax=Stentor coeruleus TaxID=5963 RepID=A0A1R2C196_9CILI|nr:hypothetical protein SteCoe_16461 [Stentor coeruleus]
MLSRVPKKLIASTIKPGLKGILNESQVRQYEEDGFLVLKNVLPAHIRDNLVRWADELEAKPEAPGKWMKYFEVDKMTGKKLLCRVENFLPFYNDLKELSYGLINDMSGDLFREDSVIYKEKINFKFPHGNGFTAHQDQPAFVSFGLKKLLTVLLPIDPNTRESGGLDFAYAWHKSREIMPQNSDGGIRTDLEARMNWFPIDATAGDMVFFDSYSPHRSDINYSTFTRRNLYLTYNPLSDGSYREKYYIEKREKFPPECERDPNKDYSEGARVFNVANPIK